MVNPTALMEKLTTIKVVNANKKIALPAYLVRNSCRKSFRKKKNRKLELKTPLRKIEGKRKIAIKVVDIFGNDTMKINEIKGRKK